MSWAAVAGAAVGVVGGALNGGSSQSTQQTIDPRVAKYLYGGEGGGGLLNGVNNLQAQQAGQGGLNPMQNAGLEMQRQALMDPRYSQGYDQMRTLGGGLLGQGVAGNPFAAGYQGGGNFGGMPRAAGVPSGIGLPQMNSTMQPAMQQIQQQQAAPQAPMTIQDLIAQMEEKIGKKPPPGLRDDGSIYIDGGSGP
jgi:hypothetical protein